MELWNGKCRCETPLSCSVPHTGAFTFLRVCKRTHTWKNKKFSLTFEGVDNAYEESIKCAMLLPFSNKNIAAPFLSCLFSSIFGSHL